MFLDFYSLREDPFGVTPDTRYMYLGEMHREALATLIYGIETGRGFLALVGRAGVGKTTLLYRFLEQFEGTARTAFVFQTQCNAREFMQMLLRDLLGDEASADDLDLVHIHEKFNELLLREAAAGRRVIVIIDEAQNLDDSVLETVRLLSDFETGQSKLLQIVLAGQERLATKLKSPGLVQLRQRLSMVVQLRPFSPENASEYIDHRLRIAGYFGPDLFTPAARELLIRHSLGIPRNLHTLCFNSLSLGCAMQSRVIDEAMVREVLADLSLDGLEADESAVPVEPNESAFDTPTRSSASVEFGRPLASSSKASAPKSSPAIPGQMPISATREPLPPHVPKPRPVASPPAASTAFAPMMSVRPVTTATPMLQRPVAERPSVTLDSVAKAYEPAREIESQNAAATRPEPRPGPIAAARARNAEPVRVAAPAIISRPDTESDVVPWIGLRVRTAVGLGVALLVIIGALAGVQRRLTTRPADPVQASVPEASSTGSALGSVEAKANGDDTSPSRVNTKPETRPAKAETRRTPRSKTPSTRTATVVTYSGGTANRAGAALPRTHGPSSNGGLSRPTAPSQTVASAGPTTTANSDLSQTPADSAPGTNQAPLDLAPPATDQQVQQANAAAMSGGSAPPTPPTAPTVSPSREVVPPVALQQAEPEYPAIARRTGMTGTVVLEVTVGTDGRIHQPKVLSGPAVLAAAALDAVNKWVYKPSTVGGQPVDSFLRVQVRFSDSDNQ